jgi:hypothetical protein
MKGLFYIPETQAEVKALIEDIIQRNSGNMDVMYATVLGQAFAEMNNEEEVS